MSKAFDDLADFLNNRMRMSHIYQPVMLTHLLENEGKSSVTEIAKALLLRDPTQVEYYEEITKRMPGRVLTSNRGITEKYGDVYSLKSYSELSSAEVDELIDICRNRLDRFLGDRKDRPWSHRRRSSGYISGTLRYEVLKRAGRRCELCGIHDDQKALEVDHIVPRNRGGGDDISNLQALCYSCNAMKRDTDNTDFRGVVDSYNYRIANCRFCDPEPEKGFSSSELCYTIEAPRPASTDPILVVPKRHVEDYFDLYQPELNDIQRNLANCRRRLAESDATISGFRVELESGSASEKGSSHIYVNLVPRRHE